MHHSDLNEVRNFIIRIVSHKLLESILFLDSPAKNTRSGRKSLKGIRLNFEDFKKTPQEFANSNRKENCIELIEDSEDEAEKR